MKNEQNARSKEMFFFLSEPSPCFKKQKYSFSFYNMLIKLN